MKKKTFVCTNCGYETYKWLGRCPVCQSWESFVEESKGEISPPTEKPVPLKEIAAAGVKREKTGMEEFDRVLGGGLVPGSFILIGGEPGIGKSTLILQIANLLAEKGEKVLYCSAEESKEQIKLRAIRLGITESSLFILSEVVWEGILSATEEISPRVLIIDSIQTVYKSSLPAAAGSISQVRSISSELLRIAKTNQVSTFIIGHITKYGAIAGPKTLEHIVDVVLYFEGDKWREYRLLRSVKNRFGPTNEVGVFKMTESGIFPVSNPSHLFLSKYQEPVFGSVVTCTMEGSRPLLCEIQALVTPTFYPYPQRLSQGFDQRRLTMLLWVLEQRADLSFSSRDVFLNIVGGLKIEEPACDLSGILALSSAIKKKPLPLDLTVFGEVGLLGEVRPVYLATARIKEAKKLGYKKVLLPKENLTKDGEMEQMGVRNIREALEIFELL
ncbi:MAG: DNA repair protein RadA [candidate division WOR-3 bacterium]